MVIAIKNVLPETGDTIYIRNIPEDYPYKCCYGEGKGTIEFCYLDNDRNIVPFFCGYIPYKKRNSIKSSCSGSGHSCNADKIRFIGVENKTFWQFKDDIQKAHNAEYYTESKNAFEVDFKDLL